jgi:energy-coupling factor transporter ATP-binding protein EcfA2
MLQVHPMSAVAEVLAVAERPGAVLLPSPPVLDGTTPLEQQIVAAAEAGGIDEPTELADYAIEVLDGEALLPREPWPFSRGELQIGGLLMVLGQPFRELVLVDPTAGLDARRRRVLAGFLSDLAGEGHRITIATDDPAFA